MVYNRRKWQKMAKKLVKEKLIRTLTKFQSGKKKLQRLGVKLKKIAKKL